MPPEAAAAAAAHAERHSSWQCGVCTLLNAPAARTCEACGHPKPRPDLDAGNLWKQQQQGQGQQQQQGLEEEDPSLPPLQQSGVGGKGKRGPKAGPSAGGSGGGVGGLGRLWCRKSPGA